MYIYTKKRLVTKIQIAKLDTISFHISFICNEYGNLTVACVVQSNENTYLDLLSLLHVQMLQIYNKVLLAIVLKHHLTRFDF